MKVDGATPKRGRFVWVHHKLIHWSCAIYFPGAISRWWFEIFFLCSHLLGEMIQNWLIFFSKALKPPTSLATTAEVPRQITSSRNPVHLVVPTFVSLGDPGLGGVRSGTRVFWWWKTEKIRDPKVVKKIFVHSDLEVGIVLYDETFHWPMIYL